MSELRTWHCKACEPGTSALDPQQAARLLGQLEDWQATQTQVSKSFKFKNHYETMAFVNAVAWISHREDHHPDMQVGYNACTIRYSTHSVGGLSQNDFICAAKVDALMGL